MFIHPVKQNKLISTHIICKYIIKSNLVDYSFLAWIKQKEDGVNNAAMMRSKICCGPVAQICLWLSGQMINDRRDRVVPPEPGNSDSSPPCTVFCSTSGPRRAFSCQLQSTEIIRHNQDDVLFCWLKSWQTAGGDSKDFIDSIQCDSLLTLNIINCSDLSV